MTDDWKQMLDPPPGGLPRLIAAIRSDRSPSRLRYALALATAVALIVGIATERLPSRAPNVRAALESALDERGRVYIENGAALELPTTRPDVRMFVVAQIPPSND
jgi:ferric-dicitrate binding protein FerR (iron transport regulator)